MFLAILNELNLLASQASSAQLPFYPSDYKGTIDKSTFARFSVVYGTASSSAYQGDKKVTGLVVISLFYPSGRGQKAPLEFIDSLDSVFQDKIRLSGKLQTHKSSIQFMGVDPSDNSLSRADYSVPFTYYGEI